MELSTYRYSSAGASVELRLYMLDILISATERACHVLLLPPLLILLLLLLLVPCALLLLADLALPGSFVVVLAGLCSC